MAKRRTTAKRLPPDKIGSDEWFKRFQWGKVLSPNEVGTETFPINKGQIKLLQELAYLRPDNWRDDLDKALALLVKYRYRHCTWDGLDTAAAKMFEQIGLKFEPQTQVFTQICKRMEIEEFETGQPALSHWKYRLVWFALIHQAYKSLDLPISERFPEYIS